MGWVDGSEPSSNPAAGRGPSTGAGCSERLCPTWPWALKPLLLLCLAWVFKAKPSLGSPRAWLCLLQDTVSPAEDGAAALSVSGVYFSCPLTGELVRRDRKEQHLREAIQSVSTSRPSLLPTLWRGSPLQSATFSMHLPKEPSKFLSQPLPRHCWDWEFQPCLLVWAGRGFIILIAALLCLGFVTKS